MSQIELKVDGVVVYSTGGVAPPVQPPIPPVQPPVPPPPPSVGRQPSDAVWDLHPTQLWPQAGNYITGSGDRGASVAFQADAVRFPNGFTIEGRDETQPSVGKDYVISRNPYSFEPVDGNFNAVKPGASNTMGPIYLRCGPVQPRIWYGQTLPSLDVALTPSEWYYVNFREHKEPGDTSQRGTVHSEFVCYDRTN